MSESTENRVKKSKFSQIKAEFKKIVWPDRNSAAKQSVAVVFISIMLGIIIGVLDVIFQYGVDFLVNLSF
jgi:preprotein translocase subunit SecE